jgi:hypothetical protein
MKSQWIRICLGLLVAAWVLVATGCEGIPSEPVTQQSIVEDAGDGIAPAEIDGLAMTNRVEGEPEPALIPTVTVEVSPPEPFCGVVMPASMGYGWHREPPEENWELEWVAFSVKSFIPEPVYVDKAVVEVDGKVEEVPLDVELHFGEYKEYTMQLHSINDMPSGEHELKVSLWSGEQLLCFRSDTARVYWQEPLET